MLDCTEEYARLERKLDEAFCDNFMQPEIIQINNKMDAIDEYGIDVDSVIAFGDSTFYIARLSASGYLDCTDWCIAESLSDAADQLIQYYAED